MRRYAPVATPITMSELLTAGRAIFGGRANLRQFEELFRETIGARHAFAVSSGRAALYIILKTLKRISSRTDIIVPAYTCPIVAAAIVKSGLKVVLCDIDKTGFGYDIIQLKRLMDDNTLAVICVHLFGIPTDVDQVIALAAKGGVFVIEDMAQFATVPPDGTTAIKSDVAFYSFGRGKNITAGAGGVIVTRSDILAKEVLAALSECKKARLGDSLKAFLQMFFYFMFIRPSLYFIPENLPFLRLGKTIYSTDFRIKPFTAPQSAMGILMLKKLNNVNGALMQKAKSYSEKLKGIPEVILPTFANNGAIYLRYPILINDMAIRNDIYSDLRAKGLGASTMYPEPLNRIKDLRPHLVKEEAYPNAERIANQLITLPTHHFVREEDIGYIAKVIAGHLSHSAAKPQPDY